MKNSNIVALYAICSMLFLSGCAAEREVRVAPLYADDPYWQRVTAKQASEVLVTEGDLKRKYQPIAKIHVESEGSDKGLSFDRMKLEAAKIGADAVVQIKVTTQYEGQAINPVSGQSMGPINRHFLEGTAVIFE